MTDDTTHDEADPKHGIIRGESKHSILRGETDSVVRIDINLTRLNKYAVVCLICGGMVQNTGVGGFDTAEEANAVVQDHRREHARLLALEIEQGETAELPTFTWPEPKSDTAELRDKFAHADEIREAAVQEIADEIEPKEEA